MTAQNTLVLPVAISALVLFGLISGFFYAFSVDVMRGLDRIDPTEAIHAMQGLNSAVRNPVFFVTFFLTPAVAVVAAMLLYLGSMPFAAIAMFSAAIVYLIGAFLPTVAVNVPMNEALARIVTVSGDPLAAEIWRNYSADWTFWNTLRTIASTLSLALCGVSLYIMK